VLSVPPWLPVTDFYSLHDTNSTVIDTVSNNFYYINPYSHIPGSVTLDVHKMLRIDRIHKTAQESAMKILLLLLFGLLFSSSPVFTQPRINVIPYPQGVTFTETEFVINEHTKIILGTGSGSAEKFAAGELKEFLQERTGINVSVADEGESLPDNIFFIGLIEKSPLAKVQSGARISHQLGDEGYFLDVTPKGVYISANGSPGAYYGIMTLMQLTESGENGPIVPGLSITDYPALKFRGISDDISRGQVSILDDFKNIIRRLAFYKQNVYMPYLEDMFRFESHPLIGKNRGALTKEQIAELDVYARNHHVEIIPIFQTLGHMENMLLTPEYVEYAEFPGAGCLNVTDERIYSLLEGLLNEIVPAFSSKYFHMAADESWDVGRGSSKELVSKEGLEKVHADHFTRVYNMIKAMGKEVMMYGDIATGLGWGVPGYPDVLGYLPEDITMVYWDYRPITDFDDKANIFRHTNTPFIVSPAIWNWHRIYPDYISAPINIRGMAETGAKTGAIGFINSSWGDFGGETFRELNWYGFIYGAECAWSPSHADLRDFNSRFKMNFYGTADVRLDALYSILANLGSKYTNHDLFRHPLIPPSGTEFWDQNPQFVRDFNQVKTDIAIARELIDGLLNDDTVPRNSRHLDYLAFAVRKGEIFVNKVEYGWHIARLGEESSQRRITADEKTRVLENCDRIITDFGNLKSSFVDLWKSTNLEANLNNLLISYYDRQLSYWTEIKEYIERDEYVIEAYSPSKFIYHTDARSYESGEHREPHVYFRKTFTVEDPSRLESALVQTAGDTRLKIFINGREIGESYAKRTLSQIVQMQRTRFWDIQKYLVAGENVIAIEAFNYERAGSAGVNWYSELTFKDGRMQRIISDDSWKVMNVLQENWIRTDFDDMEWKQAKIVDERVPLLDKPNFTHGRRSMIFDRVWTAMLYD
jgi:hexosaminidase